MTPETLTTFFAWMTLLNFGLLAFAGLSIVLLKDWMASVHSSLVGISKEDAIPLYFNWLGAYKRQTLIFSLVPYLALRIAY